MTNVLEPVLPLKPTVILQNYSIFLIKVYLTYNSMLVLGVQQSDSLIYIYKMYMLFSTIDHYKILTVTPCAIQ